MRVRGAAGLLLAPVFWVFAQSLSRVSFPASSQEREFAWRSILWTNSSDSTDKLIAVLRDGALAAIVLIAIFGLFGKGRYLVLLAALFQLVCFAPWVYYDLLTLDPFPPDWTRNIPWYPASNAVAVLWIVVLAVAALMAATSKKLMVAVPATQPVYQQPQPTVMQPVVPYPQPTAQQLPPQYAPPMTQQQPFVQQPVVQQPQQPVIQQPQPAAPPPAPTGTSFGPPPADQPPPALADPDSDDTVLNTD